MVPWRLGVHDPSPKHYAHARLSFLSLFCAISVQFFSAMYSPELGFKYNKRVATVVIPSLFLVFAFGGAMLAGVFSAGVAAILIASASGLAPPLLSYVVSRLILHIIALLLFFCLVAGTRLSRLW